MENKKKIIVLLSSIGWVVGVLLFKWQVAIPRGEHVLKESSLNETLGINNSKGVEYTILADSNYLGIIEVPIAKLRSQDSTLTFSFKINNEVISIATFNYKQVSNSVMFPIGIPIQKNSLNKIIKIQIFSDKEILTISNPVKIKFNYIYPTEYVIHNPTIVIGIIKSVLEQLVDNQSIFLVIEGVLLIFCIVWFSNNIGLNFTIGNFIVAGLIFFNNKTLTNDLIISGSCSAVMVMMSNLWESIPTNKKQAITSKKVVLFVIAVLLFSISYSKWSFLGGDETRLYYNYPQKYLQNYVSNLVENTSISNTSTYLPVAVLKPFTYFLIILKKVLPGQNIQKLLFNLNIVVALVCFYMVIKNVTPMDKYQKIAAISGGLMYIYSPFNAYTIYTSQNFSQYTLAYIPFSLYLFQKYFKNKKINTLLTFSIVTSILPVFAMIPFFASTVITLIPLILFIIKKSLVSSVKAIVLVSVVFIVLNLSWIGHFSMMQINNTLSSDQKQLFNVGSQKQLFDGVVSTSKLLNPLYPLFGIFPIDIQKNFHWPQFTIYQSWTKPLVFINTWIPISMLILVFIWVKNRRDTLGVVLIVNFFWAIYLFCGNLWFDEGQLFAKAISVTPILAMFRNMFDKFALPLSFILAMLVSISISNVLRMAISQKVKNIYICFTMLFVVFNIKPTLLGEYMHLPIWTTNSYYGSTQKLNSDYLQLMNEIQKLPIRSKVLSLPLNQGNLALIRDEFEKNHYYIGVSPTLILSGKNDISGILSFGTHQDEAKKLLDEEKYEEFGKLLSRLGITHISMNNDIDQELINSYIFNKDYIQKNNKLLETLVGEKIISINGKYQLYKVQDRFKNTSEINIDRISEGYYKVTKPSNKYILLENYSKYWVLKNDNKIQAGSPNGTFGITWSPKETLNSQYIYFKPMQYKKIFDSITLIGYVCVLFLVLCVAYEKIRHVTL